MRNFYALSGSVTQDIVTRQPVENIG